MNKHPIDLDHEIINCTQEAFRLQTLSSYAVPEEDEDFSAFLAGTPIPEREGDAWLESIAAARAQGVKRINIHVLPEKLTPYLKYALEWWYSYREAAGEEVRFVLSSSKVAHQLRAVGDFWLLDTSRVVKMHYGPHGAFLGMSVEKDVERFLKARTLALEHSVSLRELLRLRRNASE